MDPKILYPVHNSPPSVPALSHMIPVRAVPYDVINITRSSCRILLLLLLLLTAIGLSLGGSSPYTSTDKTNKNKYT
jgi:hypothetical protein